MATGVVVSFDLQRGFGFIRSSEFREDVFVHVEDVDGRVPLKAGQRVEFEARPSDRGPRATRVIPGAAGLSPAMETGGVLVAILVAVTVGLRQMGLGWGGAYLRGVGVATWVAFAWDKRKAGRGGRRIAESALLGLSLAGGSPVAALAMLVLRHKTSKPSFLVKFALVVAAQILALAAWWAWRR